MTERLIAFSVLLAVLGTPAGVILAVTSQYLTNFVFYYPLTMSGIWMAGGLFFWWKWERHWRWGYSTDVPQLKDMPLISILIPSHNEGDNILDTLDAATGQHYPNIEIIVINDGSTDRTGELCERYANLNPKVRVIHLAHNQGKAMALRMGALAAKSEYLVCIDGDAMLAPDACAYLVAPLIKQKNVGAVTGNPRIRTRSTLIGRIQVGEFSSIIGLIKRTQRVYGRVFSVSGVVAAFKRSALHDVGYWSLDMITEDIDITWKLQLARWNVFYEPRALCWILMPETLRGLWKQRLRWARGGAEVFLKNLAILLVWQHRRMWLLMLDYALSTLWAFSLAVLAILWLWGKLFGLPDQLSVAELLPPSYTGLILAAVCLLQFGISILIDRRYEPGLTRSLYWIVWYPFVYWLISLTTTLFSFPSVMLRIRRQRARWSSPDRGIKEQP
ncbi:MAG: poly-beta-1,6 N-acetyl-D-glucosamine synthase [Pusillimonas sp.]|jgi:biofilm PGA synthesis N-glycosyltransferase PgaC|nr:poly-beta-1,6 N-acetyl-D-glucosamine synthase [Pusillimonas sp.]